MREVIWSASRFISPVECFFVISAFFFFKKVFSAENRKDSKILEKYVLRLAVLYVIWSIPYYPYIVKNFCGRSWIHNLASLIYQYVVTGYSLQTWYIPSLVFGVIVVQSLSERVKNRPILFGSFALSVAVLLWGKSYYYMLPKNIIIDTLVKTGLISLFRSIPFVFVGMWFAYVHRNNMKNETMDILYWVIFGGLSLVEIYCLKTNKWAISYDFYVCICPTVYFLIKKCIVGKQVTASQAKILGKMSTVIYFSHIVIRDLILKAWMDFGNEIQFNGYILWGATFFFSALLAFGIIKIGNKLKILRYLY